MRLLRKPFKPSSLPVTPVLRVTRAEMPQVWLPYFSSDLGSELVA
jgi:hypothetical protein